IFICYLPSLVPFSSYSYIFGCHPHLHSFPTRRSSDLEAIHSRHLEIRDQQIVRINAHPVECGTAVGRDIDIVFGERERLREQVRSEEHTSELQSRVDLVCRLLLEKKKRTKKISTYLGS